MPYERARVPLWIAALVCAAGIVWRVWGSSTLGARVVFNTAIVSDALRVSGPYRYMRNPLYLGLSLYAFGIALIGHPLTVVIVFTGINVLQLALIRSEEASLTAAFGERYLAYVRAVPSLIPALRPQLPDAGAKPAFANGLRAEAWVIALAAIAFGSALALGR